MPIPRQRRNLERAVATEDPNPTSKVEERRMLEEMGREAIKERMDPRVVDAVRSVRALEEGVELDELDRDEEGEGDEGEGDWLG
ncbi:hypothetical protein NMY22_g16984 [Coprinellus aureogranulatus]|nr:hypothetical protein NMY22_g16984 [Coprinellus aureogranulatus]